QRVQGVDLASKFPRSQSNRASEGCAGKISQIHGGPTSQLTGLKGFAANVLVPYTTGHLQRTCGVHASTGQSCFDGTWGTYTILAGAVLILWLIGVCL
ncbi:hypothetical protein LDENG_00089500, partial [Lucifuga dentata]